MNYRTLGRTGLHVSEIGYGAWGIGKGLWIGASDDESLKALNKAFDLGLNFVDTALAYGATACAAQRSRRSGATSCCPKLQSADRSA
jgi:aryl-alcohol dehydrogenase-like predicted oxidoreductase